MSQGQFNQHVGRKLRAARQAAGLSAKSASERMGVSKELIFATEKGRSGMQLHKLWQLCAVLKIDIAELLPPSDLAPEVLK